MTRKRAIHRAARHFNSGAYLTDFRRRVSYRTESQDPGGLGALHDYLEEIAQALRNSAVNGESWITGRGRRTRTHCAPTRERLGDYRADLRAGRPTRLQPEGSNGDR